ncbi:hypothetical protein TYRP_011678 [Tyrophagus putrescentiae]|nr:hypothetical protein TYRP_011678 [Tyrophagus putrescentiae]
MPVVVICTNRTWTSVNATELNDNILNDGIFQGPTYITRDELGIPPDENGLYNGLSVHSVRDQTYSTRLKVATVLSRFLAHGYTLVSQTGAGVGTSGKARYSADVSVNDYRWMWTLVRPDGAPPPYAAAAAAAAHFGSGAFNNANNSAGYSGGSAYGGNSYGDEYLCKKG